MKTPLVSVIIPAYNAAQTLGATVQSVLVQTFQDFEIIIVNDGSKDTTVEVAEQIADSRIKIISQANGGVSSARNNGIRSASGKYIALLDSDDLWVPEKLELQINFLESRDDVFAVHSGAYFVNDDLEIISVHPCDAESDPILDAIFFRNMPNSMSTLVVDKQKMLEVGLFDTELEILEDWDLMIRVTRFCNMRNIEKPLSLYRVYTGNRSRDLDIHIKPGFIVLKRLFEDPRLPEYIRKQKKSVYSTFYNMLSGGSLKIGHYKDTVKWSLKAIAAHPGSALYILGLPLRRLRKNQSRNLAVDKYKLDQAWLDALRTNTVS